jgi:hypothetical protein
MILDYLKYVNYGTENKAYVVKREIPTHNFSQKDTNKLNMEFVKAWRDYLDCDHVLRTQTHFLFCQTIPEAEIIEEHDED